MNPVRLRAAGLAALPLTALALLAPSAVTPAAAAPTAAATSSPAADAVRPVGRAELRVGPALARPTAVLPAEVSTAAVTARFNVTYVNFSPAAKAAFQRAVDMWSRSVASSVPITVRAEYEPLGSGVLGSAGPSQVYRDFGRGRPGTWYVDALANKLAGRQLDASPDIRASFSSSFRNWHFGSGPAPRDTYDFTSVVAHEIGHGLGFLGGTALSGRDDSLRLVDRPAVYDRFAENGAGKALLSYADPSAALRTQLTSGNVFFDSPAVRNANGGRPAELFAPSRFQPGSSYSHLDEARFGAGSANALMTPRIGTGETVRTPGPVGNALLRSLGW